MAAIPRPDERPPVTVAADRVETILLATDLTLASSAATDRAIELAARLGARLLVVHVMRSVTVEERATRTTHATQVVTRARSEGIDASFLVWEGVPGEGILAAAEAEGADMIVVGSHARGSMGRALLGSVSDHLVHRAAIPVLVVRPRPSDLS